MFTINGEYPLLNIFVFPWKICFSISSTPSICYMLFPHWAVSENKWFLSWHFFFSHASFFCYLSISHRRSWQTTDEEVCRTSWHQRHTAMHWTGRWEIGVENWKIDLEIESDNNQIHQWTSIRAESKGKLSIKSLFQSFECENGLWKKLFPFHAETSIQVHSTRTGQVSARCRPREILPKLFIYSSISSVLLLFSEIIESEKFQFTFQSGEVNR